MNLDKLTVDELATLDALLGKAGMPGADELARATLVDDKVIAIEFRTEEGDMQLARLRLIDATNLMTALAAKVEEWDARESDDADGG